MTWREQRRKHLNIQLTRWLRFLSTKPLFKNCTGKINGNTFDYNFQVDLTPNASRFQYTKHIREFACMIRIRERFVKIKLSPHSLRKIAVVISERLLLCCGCYTLVALRLEHFGDTLKEAELCCIGQAIWLWCMLKEVPTISASQRPRANPDSHTASLF